MSEISLNKCDSVKVPIYEIPTLPSDWVSEPHFVIVNKQNNDQKKEINKTFRIFTDNLKKRDVQCYFNDTNNYILVQLKEDFLKKYLKELNLGEIHELQQSYRLTLSDNIYDSNSLKKYIAHDVLQNVDERIKQNPSILLLSAINNTEVHYVIMYKPEEKQSEEQEQERIKTLRSVADELKKTYINIYYNVEKSYITINVSSEFAQDYCKKGGKDIKEIQDQYKLWLIKNHSDSAMQERSIAYDVLQTTKFSEDQSGIDQLIEKHPSLSLFSAVNNKKACFVITYKLEEKFYNMKEKYEINKTLKIFADNLKETKLITYFDKKKSFILVEVSSTFIEEYNQKPELQEMPQNYKLTLINDKLDSKLVKLNTAHHVLRNTEFGLPEKGIENLIKTHPSVSIFSAHDIHFVIRIGNSKQKNEKKTVNLKDLVDKIKGVRDSLLNPIIYELNQKTYILVHVSLELAEKYSELLMYRMSIIEKCSEAKTTEDGSVISKLTNFFKTSSKKGEHFWTDSNESRSVLLTCNDGKYSESYFSKSTRICIAHYILQNIQFQGNTLGIEELMRKQSDVKAYPLHDGEYDENVKGKETNLRNKLYNNWAKISNVCQVQPIDDIKEYFGAKVALYFAWLGLYTNMLMYGAIFGILTMLYGWITLKNHSYTNQICNSTITMCSPCIKNSSSGTWLMRDSCTRAKLTHLFDNNINIFFTAVMTIWSLVYLKLWKRYSAVLTYKWGIFNYDVDDEMPRLDYVNKVKNLPFTNQSKTITKYRIGKNTISEDKIKNNAESDHKYNNAISLRTKIPIIFFNFSTVVILVALVAFAVFGVIVYRMSLYASRYSFNIENSNIQDLVTNSTAAIINLVVIIMLNQIYNKIAIKMTDREYLRTQTEYENSLIVKLYLFQFVNYYSSVFYIAFLKGKLVGSPAKYNTILGICQEECKHGGCYLELFLQLSTILIGNKIINYIPEFLKLHKINLKPSFCKCLRKSNASDENKPDRLYSDDHELQQYSSMNLSHEYNEMVIQYGFVVLFVNAYPIAPLMALINNMFEMRSDALKYVTYYRRVIPERATNIGIWLSIMELISRLSIFSNAVMIAFSSKFIPYMVYLYEDNIKKSNDLGFLNHTLASYKYNDTGKICYYKEYRYPFDHDKKYELSRRFYFTLVCRITFVIIFQVIVSALRIFIDWVISDVPRSVNNRLKEEKRIVSEILLNKLNKQTIKNE